MANSQNLCLFTGNIGNDIEIRYTQSGSAVGNLSIAVNGSVKKGDQWVDETTWVRLIAFGKRAETLQKYTQKGSKIRVECKYQNRKWQDNNGQYQYSHEFLINNLELLDKKSDAQPQQQPAPQQPEYQPVQQPATAQKPASQMNTMNDIDDDIPF